MEFLWQSMTRQPKIKILLSSTCYLILPIEELANIQKYLISRQAVKGGGGSKKKVC